MRFHGRLFALAFVASFASADCSVGSSPSSFDPADIVSLAGAYDYTFSLETLVDEVNNPMQRVSCTGAGDIDIEHSQGAAQFTGELNGSVSCDGPDDEVDADHTSSIMDSGANPEGFTFGFTFPLFESDCSLSDGTTSDDPVDELSADMTCVLDVNGEDIILVGTWQATR